MTHEEEAQLTVRPSASWGRRIGVSVLSLLALSGIVAVVAYYASHGGHHSKAAASTATKDGSAIQPMSFTTMDDVVSELNAKIEEEQTEAKIEMAKQAGATGMDIVNATNSKANATGVGGGVFFSSVPQVQQKPFQVKIPAVNNKAPSESTCVAADFDELKDAIENDACQFVTLTGREYEIEEEIIVSRSVTITGNPQTMPALNAEDAPRTFRVLAGAFLEVRFASFVMSEGVERDPLPWEGATTPKVIEVRGGSVFFEAGAIGGNFVNCFFLDDRDVGAGLEAAIEQTMEQATVRIYGGHVFIVNGNVNFYNCLIFDLTILYPLTNFLIIGGDVLNLAGTLNFVACTWIETTIFGVENGVGLFVANIAGITLYTFNNFDEQNGAVMENCLGQAYFVGGGVQVMTASLINEYSGIVAYTGSGELTVLAGVSILTGIGNQEGFGIGTSIGIGMEYTVGPAAVVHTGASMQEYNGLFFMAALGELTWVGSGFFAATGSPMIEYLAISGEYGQGGSFWIGSGYASFIGSVQIESDAIAGVYLTGEYVCNDAGFVVWIGCPTLEFVPLEHGGNVIGSIIYIGMGALVIGGSPVYEAYTSLVTHTVEFWVGGTCETEGGEGTTTTAGGESTRALVDPYQRQLYDLPWFVAPVQGCQKIVGMFEKSFSGISSGSGSGGGGETSRSLAVLPDPNAALKEKQKLAALAPSKKHGPTSHLPEQVRRHATNYHRPKGDRRLMEQKDAVPDVGLFAFNVQRHTNQYDLSAIEGLVPAETIKTLAGLKEKMVEINGGQPLETNQDRPLFHVDSKVDGYCGLCNVDGAEGPGTQYCEMKDSCADLENAPASVRRPMDTAQAALEEKKLEFDEHYLVLAEITPTTRADVETLDMAELQEAIVASIAHLQGAEDVEREAVIVNLFSAAADLHWADLMPPPKRNLAATDVFSKTHNFKFVTIATDRKTSEMMAQAMMPEVAGEDSPLAKQIKETFQAHTGVEIGHMGLEYDREMYIPAYNSNGLLQHDRRHLGTHSTVLVDPEAPAVPISHVEYKRPYHILLEHYPPNVHIDVRLMRLKDNVHEDLPMESPVALPIKTVTTNTDGEATVKFVFDHGSVRPGEYFVQVTFPDGHVAYSPSYVVSHEGRKRKLYGSHMEIMH